MKVYSCNRHKVFKMGQTKTLDSTLGLLNPEPNFCVNNAWPFLLLEPMLSAVSAEWYGVLSHLSAGPEHQMQRIEKQHTPVD